MNESKNNSLEIRMQQLLTIFKQTKETDDNKIHAHIPDMSSYEAHHFMQYLKQEFPNKIPRFEQSYLYKNGQYIELNPSEKPITLARLQAQLIHKQERLKKIKNIEIEKNKLIETIVFLESQIKNIKSSDVP